MNHLLHELEGQNEEKEIENKKLNKQIQEELEKENELK